MRCPAVAQNVRGALHHGILRQRPVDDGAALRPRFGCRIEPGAGAGFGPIAVQGGTKAELDLGSLLRRRLTVTGSTLRPRSVAFKAAIAQHLRTTVWPLIEAGKIKPVIYQTFPLEKANEAHALMEASTHVGKIMLQVA